jgi:hypothetical protein
MDRSPKKKDARQLAAAGKEREPGVEPVTKDHAGQTTPSQTEERLPRLPHERDESVDSQAGQAGELPSAVKSQAFDDVQRGLVNTDRGLEANTLVSDKPSRRKKRRDNPPI